MNFDFIGELAKQGFGFFLAAGELIVIFYMYKLIQKLQDKRLEDWQTVLSTTNDLAKATQESQKTTAIIVNGIDETLKIIKDRLDGRTKNAY